jgi:hypothetical protein
MTKYTLIGVLSCLGGGVLIGFQAVSSAMGVQRNWQSLSLKDVLGGQYLEWMGNASFGGAERIIEYIVTMPLLFYCSVSASFFCAGLLSGRR